MALTLQAQTAQLEALKRKKVRLGDQIRAINCADNTSAPLEAVGLECQAAEKQLEEATTAEEQALAKVLVLELQLRDARSHLHQCEQLRVDAAKVCSLDSTWGDCIVDS